MVNIIEIWWGDWGLTLSAIKKCIIIKIVSESVVTDLMAQIFPSFNENSLEVSRQEKNSSSDESGEYYVNASYPGINTFRTELRNILSVNNEKVNIQWI